MKTDFGTKDFASGGAPAKMMLATDTVQLITSVPAVKPAVVDLQLYPNPAADDVVVRWTLSRGQGPVVLCLSNAMGQVVLRYRASGSEARLRVAGSPRGLYMLRLESERGGCSRRLVLE